MKFFFMSMDIYPFLEGFSKSTIVGGAEKQQFLIISELIRREHEVVICTNVSKEQRESFYKIVPFSRGKQYLKYAGLLLTLIRFMPDVVYLRSPSNLGIALVAYTTIFRKKMVFFSAHDTDFDTGINLQGYNPFMFWIFLKLANLIFVQNRYQNDLLKRNFHRNGIEFGNVIEPSDEKLEFNLIERKYYLWIGRIEPFKRIELLFDIAEKMPRERFVAVAPANVENEYTHNTVGRIREVGNIDHIGFVKPEDIKGYLLGSKGLICTSKHEGFSNTFLEAWSTGTPVYTLGVDPNEVIQMSKGKLGFVFCSTGELADGIQNVLSFVDTDYMKDYLREHHSLKTNVDRFLRLVSE